MNYRIALCAGLAALGVAGATAAQAQVYVEPPRGYVEPPRGYVEPPPQMIHGGLPPSEILMILRASGLRPLTQPARRGGQYLILASDNMGGQLRVVVSAHNGRILNAEPAYDPRFASGPMRPRGMVPVAPPQHAAVDHPRYAAPPPDLRTPSAPPPPRSARTNSAPQNHRLASTPDAASAAPAPQPRTPLPRPRPTIAAAETSAAPEAAPTTPAAAAPASPPPAAASAAPAKPETQMVPVAPLE